MTNADPVLTHSRLSDKELIDMRVTLVDLDEKVRRQLKNHTERIDENQAGIGSIKEMLSKHIDDSAKSSMLIAEFVENRKYNSWLAKQMSNGIDWLYRAGKALLLWAAIVGGSITALYEWLKHINKGPF